MKGGPTRLRCRQPGVHGQLLPARRALRRARTPPRLRPSWCSPRLTRSRRRRSGDSHWSRRCPRLRGSRTTPPSLRCSAPSTRQAPGPVHVERPDHREPGRRRGGDFGDLQPNHGRPPIHVHEYVFRSRTGSRGDRRGDAYYIAPAGGARPPEPAENGWKETVIAYPGEDDPDPACDRPPRPVRLALPHRRARGQRMMRPYRIGPEQPGQPGLPRPKVADYRPTPLRRRHPRPAARTRPWRCGRPRRSHRTYACSARTPTAVSPASDETCDAGGIGVQAQRRGRRRTPRCADIRSSITTEPRPSDPGIRLPCTAWESSLGLCASDQQGRTPQAATLRSNLCPPQAKRPPLRLEKRPLTSTFGGAEGIRTPDPLHAMQVRYQLRHSPAVPRGEPLTPVGARRV